MTEQPAATRKRWILQVAALAIVYLLVAKLSMVFGSYENVTPIWPAGGIALAAVMRLGFRVWPGIALGAFLDPLTTGLPVAIAVGVSIANTAAPCLGVWLLRRSIGDRSPFEHARDVSRFITLSGLLGAAVAATIGAASICATTGAPWASFPDLWRPWWLSDLVGMLVVAPVLLLDWRPLSRLVARPARAVEGVILLALIVTVGEAVFGKFLTEPAIFIPLLLWSVFRFGSLGAALSVLTVSVLGVRSMVGGTDAFASLLVLQIFIAAISTTFLILAAVLSERRRAESELAHYNRTLEQEVAERTAELEAKNQELTATLDQVARRSEDLERSEERARSLLADLEVSQKTALENQRLASLGELAGGVGYEVRNPLAALRESIDRLRVKQAPSPEAEEILARVEADVERADRVATELLDYSRDPQRQVERVLLQALVKRSIAAVRFPELVYVGQSLQEEPLLVEVDRRQIEHCLVNLLRNAVKAMPDGGRMQVACHRRGAEAVCLVRDTGAGLAGEQLARVFEPLFEGRSEGTGLALPVAQRYAQLNGGRIECESEPGKGSAFRLVLLLTAAEDATKV